MLNHITLMGRLTRDPEARTTNNGKSVTGFTLAVDRDFGREYGEVTTDFINIVTWNKTADFVSQYFKKGQLVVVSGRLQMRDWEDKNGNKRTIAKVIADNVYFGERKQSTAEGATEKLKSVEFEDFDDDGELPF